MGKPPAFQFYPSDFLTGTTFMSHAEVGGYIRLLCHQWDKGPLEKEPVMNILAPLSDTEIKTVLSKFRAKNGKYFNQRLATERKKFNDYKRQQRLNAQKRWGKHQKSDDTTAMPTHSHGNATAMPKGMPNTCSSSSSSLSSSINKKKKNIKKKSATKWPKDFELTEARRSYADNKGIPDVQATWDQFENYHKAKGNAYVDWEAAWRTWVNSPYQKKVGCE